MLRNLALALAVAGVLLVAGSAAADGPPETPITVSAEPPTDPILPDRHREIPLLVEGYCQQAGPANAAYVGDRKVHLSASSDTHLDAQVDPATVTLPRRPCQEEHVQAEATLEVHPHPTAEAFRMTEVSVVARTDDSSAQTAVPVQFGYRPRLQVDGPDEPVDAEAGSTVQVPLAVANTGNGESKIRFEVAEAAGSLTVGTPEPFVLPPELGSAEDPVRLVEVPVTVDGDAPTGDALPVTLEVTPAYALDTNRVGPAFEATFAVEVHQTASTAEAALLPAVGAAVLAGGVAVARLRRWG